MLELMNGVFFYAKEDTGKAIYGSVQTAGGGGGENQTARNKRTPRHYEDSLPADHRGKFRHTAFAHQRAAHIGTGKDCGAIRFDPSGYGRGDFTFIKKPRRTPHRLLCAFAQNQKLYEA
ncbi:MAG: hypothetical protein VB023_05375 [Oscillibacter sp.]|nr:hypothetical protein [Oscillibacter sp.]